MRHRGYFIIFICLLALGMLSGCAEQKTAQDSAPYKPASYNLPPLTLILLPEESSAAILERFMPLKYYLETAIQRTVILRITRDYESAIDELGHDKDYLAFLDPATYCEVKYRHGDKIVPLLKTFFKKGDKSHSVLVARDTSEISKAVDARGKRLALGSKKSTFSYLVPVSMLNDVNIKLNDLSQISLLQQEDRVALSVLIGDHDIGGISESIAKKYIADGLKIVGRSEPVSRFVIAAPASLDKDAKEAVMRAFTTLKDQGRLSLIDPSITGFVKAEDKDFDVIRAMIFSQTGKEYRKYGRNVIKVAVLPLYSAITIYERYDPLMQYLSDKTGYTFKLFIPKDFEDFVRVIKSGTVDFSYQNPYIFTLIDRDYRIKPLVTTLGEDTDETPPEITHGDTFRGVIITRHDSPIKGIEDLKGKRVMITSPKSAGGFLSQKIFLKQKGIVAERDMLLIDAKRQESVILGVYRGEAEAGFVRESALVVWKNSIDMSKIKVLAKTTPLPNWPFTANRNMNPRFVEEVRSLLLTLKDKDVLGAARIKGFVPASDEKFEALRQY